MITPLYQLIDERLSAFKPLLKLVGRMQMLQSQLVAQQASQSHVDNAPSDPALVFDEAAEEEEEAGHEGEEGEEGEEEDDDEFDDDDDEFDDDDDEFDHDDGEEDEDDDIDF